LHCRVPIAFNNIGEGVYILRLSKEIDIGGIYLSQGTKDTGRGHIYPGRKER
jgi:hypothetical protein